MVWPPITPAPRPRRSGRPPDRFAVLSPSLSPRRSSGGQCRLGAQQGDHGLLDVSGCDSGSGLLGWARREPAWARAAGSRRDLARLATVVTARMATITAREVRVGISGTASDRVWPQC